MFDGCIVPGEGEAGGGVARGRAAQDQGLPLEVAGHRRQARDQLRRVLGSLGFCNSISLSLLLFTM